MKYLLNNTIFKHKCFTILTQKYLSSFNRKNGNVVDHLNIYFHPPNEFHLKVSMLFVIQIKVVFFRKKFTETNLHTFLCNLIYIFIYILQKQISSLSPWFHFFVAFFHSKLPPKYF